MCSEILCQCLQQIREYLWLPLCEKIWIFCSYLKQRTEPIKTKKRALKFFKHKLRVFGQILRWRDWIAATCEKGETERKRIRTTNHKLISVGLTSFFYI